MTTEIENSTKNDTPRDFLRAAITADLAEGRSTDVVTRFPPEPNGHLHLGHAKAICVNFGIAAEFGGRCNLRFDDTNPVKEEQAFVDAQMADMRWLGFDWGERELYASDYYEQLFDFACELIGKGVAYVDDQSADDMRAARGTLTKPGTNSPFRDRPAEENLELFRRMRAGEFADGAKVLRAKIDMASPNLNLRDPVMYRILHAHHHRTGDNWCIYPMYDWAHGQSDSILDASSRVGGFELRPHFGASRRHNPIQADDRCCTYELKNVCSTFHCLRPASSCCTRWRISSVPEVRAACGVRRKTR